MPILDENKNILCVRTTFEKDGTERKKQHYLNPSVVKNPVWMKTNKWEIVQEPQEPPVTNGFDNNENFDSESKSDLENKYQVPPLAENNIVEPKPKRKYRKRTTKKPKQKINA